MAWLDMMHHAEAEGPREYVWKTLHRGEHKARSAKSCTICGGTIAVGQRYCKEVALDDGRHTVINTHRDSLECSAARIAREAAERQELAQMAEEEGRYWQLEFEVQDRWDALEDDLHLMIAESYAYA